MRTNNTVVFSFDDTIDNQRILVARKTSYFDIQGNKLGGGNKPFTKPIDAKELLPPGTKKAIVIDAGIWSGETMEPLIDEFCSRNIQTQVITGFIKRKARDRFEQKGVTVVALLPFSDYDDWAELRDLMVLFIKSGFFMGRKSQVDANRVLPYGVFIGKNLTYFTQPASNLDKYYEILGNTDHQALSLELLFLSKKFWEEMESINSGLTLGKLRELFPTRFGLPLLADNQLKAFRSSSDQNPSNAIGTLYAMMKEGLCLNHKL